MSGANEHRGRAAAGTAPGLRGVAWMGVVGVRARRFARTIDKAVRSPDATQAGRRRLPVIAGPGNRPRQMQMKEPE